MTSAGRLPYKAIIHVAGINIFWRASELSIRNSVRNTLEIAINNGFSSIAFPIIGSGSGGFQKDQAISIMKDTLNQIEGNIRVTIVEFDAGH